MYRLNYQHLRYFWAVSRHGNLTRASAELHLAPQTVSSQIHDLEDGLGEKLFARQGRRLVLTDIGHVVFRYADEIFGLGRELQDVVRGLPAGRPIHLAVGVADVLPKLIARRLIEPALRMEEPVHVICHEATPERLLAERMGALEQVLVVLERRREAEGVEERRPVPPAHTGSAVIVGTMGGIEAHVIQGEAEAGVSMLPQAALEPDLLGAGDVGEVARVEHPDRELRSEAAQEVALALWVLMEEERVEGRSHCPAPGPGGRDKCERRVLYPRGSLGVLLRSGVVTRT